ncbi:MAG TPA: acyl-CoA dehydrogenase family protein [Caulobacterales bacterium]|nr:acyl-CoA dehydrogenase family protein [Caulobacterales bacterium]
MALSYSSEQEQIRGEARRFLEAAFNAEKQRRLLHARGGFDTDFWQACVNMGWTGAGVPEAFGGLGLGPLDVCILAEECGRFAVAAPFLAANYAAAIAINDHGSDAQRAALLPAIASGDARFALALFEDEDGLPQEPATRFRAGLINGRKCAVVGAAAATHALALTDSGVALVDLAKHVERHIGDTIDNSRCSGDLAFSNASGELLQGGAQALRLLAVQALVTAFEQIGGAEAAMARAQRYANTREAFGQLIGKFQAIKHRIAEMYVRNELARGNALLAATGLAEGAPDFIARSGAARLAATDAFEFAAAQSMQTHGAIGVTWEHDLHLYLRRARAQALELGSPLFWEDVVVDMLSGSAM